MSTPLTGKVAIITGSSKGIGLATAQHLSALGAKVVINYSSASSTPVANEIVSSLGGDNHALAVQADVSSIPDIEKLIATTVAKWGKIDILVANAGVMPLNELKDLTEEEFDRVVAINVKGPLFLVQKATPHMSPSSRIILFSTTLCAASTLTPNYLAYVTSKGAIEQMTRVLSKDLARKGITVNCVAPGPTATDLFLSGKSEELVSVLKGMNPQERLGTPGDVAEVVGWLGGEGSRWVTGQVLRVNGGMA